MTADYRITGKWSFRVENTDIKVPPPEVFEIRFERHAGLPLLAAEGKWAAGAKLDRLVSFETTLPDALEPASVVVRNASGRIFVRGRDYEIEERWANVGRLEHGGIRPDESVFIDYRCRLLRLDSLFRTPDGSLRYAAGVLASSCPAIPEAAPGEERILNVFLLPQSQQLDENAFFVIHVAELPPPDCSSCRVLLKETFRKLETGGQLRILAWGDSITDAGYYVADADRWQEKFACWLRKRYPKAAIELATIAKGGQNMRWFRNEPAGSQYNYRDKILDSGADLIISEFNNDHGEPVDFLEKQYSEVLADFRSKGIEWIILTSNYSSAEWMNFNGEKGPAVEKDNRSGMIFMHDFAVRNRIAFADGAYAFGQIWKLGIPYSTMLTNNINHPDARGMQYLADAIKAIFH